jgi:light-regulated signal transduction histidine kinase (bacteriophytochrome)
MNNIPKEEFELALQQCATEPIHQLGYIQPHGAVLVVNSDSQNTVLQVSQNFGTFVDIPSGESCGKPLVELLGETTKNQVDQLIQLATKKNTATGIISVIHENTHRDLLSHLYVSEGMFVIELTNDDFSQQDGQLAPLLLEFQQSLLDSESDLDIYKYLNTIVTFIRTLTNYDSVMAYRFDAHWNGEVIAQDRITTAPSFMGLHFPASDIPEQARRLYANNLVRVVVDIDAIPVAVLPSLNPVTKKPLDMTYSALRSLSPIHIEYLRNMGIQASMTISLMQNHQLWGLIACHHMSPKLSSIPMREAVIYMSRMVSAKLSSFEAIEQRIRLERANSIVNRLLKSISTHTSASLMKSLLPELQQLLDSTGLIVLVEGKIYLNGEVPKSDEIRDLLDWLGSKTESEIFSCDYLGAEFPPAKIFTDKAAGLLTTPLFKEMRNCIIWIRKEKPLTVNWAGRYEEGFVRNSAGGFRLAPRKSFALWNESWSGRCAPWTNVEIGIASMLSFALPESLSQKSQLEEEQFKLKRTEEELRESRHDLEVKVRERTADLQTANAALIAEKEQQEALNKKLSEANNQLIQSEKMASIGQLAAGVAHEINNPIGFVSSNLNTLKDYVSDLLILLTTYEESEGEMTSARRELLTDLKRKIDIAYLRGDVINLLLESADGMHRVKKIVQDLKSFSHVGETEKNWANLEQGLDSTLNVIWNELKYKTEVIKEYAGIPDIECIASQLNQVFMNLLINASHAIEDRGKIIIRTGQQDDTVWVEIEDTGKGIMPEHMNHIFDPFFTTKPVGKGTGLGLSLSYDIVKKHGGRIEVRSELGKGSAFRVVVPK